MKMDNSRLCLSRPTKRPLPQKIAKSSFKASVVAAMMGCSLLAMPALAQDSAEISFWNSVANSGSVAKLQLYLDTYPNGHFAPLAKLSIQELGGKVSGQPKKQSSVERFRAVMKKKREEARRKKQNQSSQSASNTSSPGNLVLEVPDITPRKNNDYSSTYASTNRTDAEKRCDELAGHPDDDSLPELGTPFAELKKHASQAVAACRKAIKHGDARQNYQLYRSLVALGKGVDGNKYLINAADDGHPVARFWVASHTFNGANGFQQDIRKGLDLFIANARDGDGDSIHQLGRFAYWGFKNKQGRVKVNKARAYKFYKIAEKYGLTGVYASLGDMYKRGDYLKKDLNKARHYYNLSVVNNAPNSERARKELAAGLQQAKINTRRSANIDRHLEWYKELAPQMHKMWAYLDGVESQLDGSMKSHNIFVDEIVDQIDWLLERKFRKGGWQYYLGLDKKSERVRASKETKKWLGQLTERLQNAVIRRHKRFPNRTVVHTKKSLARYIRQYHALNATGDDIIEIFFKALNAKSATGQEFPRHCIDIVPTLQVREAFLSNFTNNCKAAVRVKGYTKIDYVKRGYKDQKKEFEVVLLPGGFHQHQISARYKNERAKIISRAFSCYSVDKVRVQESDKYSCGSGEITDIKLRELESDLSKLSANFRTRRG